MLLLLPLPFTSTISPTIHFPLQPLSTLLFLQPPVSIISSTTTISSTMTTHTTISLATHRHHFPNYHNFLYNHHPFTTLHHHYFLYNYHYRLYFYYHPQLLLSYHYHKFFRIKKINALFILLQLLSNYRKLMFFLQKFCDGH